MLVARFAPLVLVTVLAAACGSDIAAPALTETDAALAQQSQGIAQEVLASTQTTYESLLQHTLTALHNHSDPEAEACLAEARALHHEARAAHDAGDGERAAQLAHQSFLKVLCAVVEVFPDAVPRTGAAADAAIDRIEQWLGQRDAPHIRQLLAHVTELRLQADRVLAEGNMVEALALNLRAVQILHRFASHLVEHHDHDVVADQQMHGVSY